jgi:hypothetical protein
MLGMLSNNKRMMEMVKSDALEESANLSAATPGSPGINPEGLPPQAVQTPVPAPE